MGSSVIFLVIIGLWVVFLVPHLVHHRAQLGGSRVRDRFSSAMRVLGRRPVPVRRSVSRGYLHRPRREHEVQRRVRSTAEPARVRRRPPLTAVLLLGLLAVLTLAVPAVAVAAALGALPAWAVPAPAAALVPLLAGLRARAVRRRRVSRPWRPASPAVETPVDAVPAQRDAEPAAVPAAEVEPPTPAATSDDGTWTPVPVPPPTYTLKPPAPRRAVAPDPQPAAPPAPASAPWDLHEVLERRRAAAG